MRGAYQAAGPTGNSRASRLLPGWGASSRLGSSRGARLPSNMTGPVDRRSRPAASCVGQQVLRRRPLPPVVATLGLLALETSTCALRAQEVGPSREELASSVHHRPL